MITVRISFFIILLIKKIWITTANMDNLAHFLGNSIEAAFKHFKAEGLSVTNLPSKQGFIHLDVPTTSFHQRQNFKVAGRGQIFCQAPPVLVEAVRVRIHDGQGTWNGKLDWPTGDRLRRLEISDRVRGSFVLNCFPDGR